MPEITIPAPSITALAPGLTPLGTALTHPRINAAGAAIEWKSAPDIGLPDAVIVGTDTAATDLANINAAIATAVAAATTRDYVIHLVGNFKVAATEFTAVSAGRVRIVGYAARIEQAGSNGTAYLRQSGAGILTVQGCRLTSASGSSTGGFCIAASWIGGVVDGWAGTLINSSIVAAHVDIESRSTAHTITLSGAGATLKLNSAYTNGNPQATVTLSGAQALFVGECLNLTISGADCAAFGFVFTALVVSGARSQFSGVARQVTLSGARSKFTGISSSTATVTGAGAVFESAGANDANTTALTVTAASCRLQTRATSNVTAYTLNGAGLVADLDLIQSALVSSPPTPTMGTGQRLLARLSAAGAVGAANARWSLASLAQGFADLTVTHEGGTGLGATALTIKSTCDGNKIIVRCLQAGDSITIEDGCEGNDITVYSDTAPVVGASAALVNRIHWIDTVNGLVYELGTDCIEFFEVNAGATTAVGDLAVRGTASGGAVSRTTLKIPDMAHNIRDCTLIANAAGTDAGWDLDLATDYGTVSEPYNQHSEADTTTTYNVTASQHFLINLLGVATSLGAGDILGVAVTNNHGSQNMRLVGTKTTVRMRGH